MTKPNQISKLSIYSKLETKPTWIVGGHLVSTCLHFTRAIYEMYCGQTWESFFRLALSASEAFLCPEWFHFNLHVWLLIVCHSWDGKAQPLICSMVSHLASRCIKLSTKLVTVRSQSWGRLTEEKWAEQLRSCQIALFWETALSYQHFLTDNPTWVWVMLLVLWCVFIAE